MNSSSLATYFSMLKHPQKFNCRSKTTESHLNQLDAPLRVEIAYTFYSEKVTFELFVIFHFLMLYTVY